MFKAILITAVVVAMTAGAAAAATMKVVVTGKVFASRDKTGEFGRTGEGALDGLGFILTYIYDTTLGTRITRVGDRVSDQLSGSVPDGTISPVTLATLQIGSVVQDFTGNSSAASIALTRLLGFDGFLFYNSRASNSREIDRDKEILIQNFVTFAAYGVGVPSDLETRFSLSGADELGTSGESYFTISETEPRTFVSIKQTSGSLRGETVTVTNLDDTPSAVPLPATALLMLTGFGGLTLLRRRAA